LNTKALLSLTTSVAADFDYAEGVLGKSLTSFKIGGPVALVAWPKSRVALISLLRAALVCGERCDVVGACTNLLIDDSGYDGLLIVTSKMRGCSINGTIFTAECGLPVEYAAIAARDAALSGLEFFYGIPGTIGGAVTMNAGAYSSEVSCVLISSEAYNCETGEIEKLSLPEHNFGYRMSVYRMAPRRVVLSASFSLSRGDRDTISAYMNELKKQRWEKQPLEYPSAGSVFKRYPGYFTAKLIEEAGLKGVRVGGAQVSEKHAGFIINTGDATAADVRALIAIITEKIRADRGIELERELIYL
jgi:UDP-N-acetylmuramate dehydrogenase